MFYTNKIKNEIEIWKLNTYKGEKIIRLANIYNKTAYLDKEYFEDSYMWGFFNTFSDREINKVYNHSPYIEFLNQFNNSKKIENDWIFTDTEKVNSEFEQNGGIFSENELKNINFNNLLNENFLLNEPYNSSNNESTGSDN
ncbi:hypothetical protein IJ182_07320 [bacterium]|nr:hypothetical protein [bacterium]